ncbi:MAG: glutathione synthase [Proteobacteria bacterium]|nr:glutathione synthase [Pseudomonadota bacterium]MDE3207718.1 glutathione synthase [Pseudomonadota bacterium]
MDIAFIASHPDTFKTSKDSTYALILEAGYRQHCLYFIQSMDVYWDGSVRAQTRQLFLDEGQFPWYALGDAQERVLAEFDVVLLRTDPPFDMEYLYLTHLLEMAEAEGAHVVNRARAVRDFNEKLAISRFPEWIVPTLVSSSLARLQEFVVKEKQAVIKPLSEMGGSGVFLLQESDPNLHVILESITCRGSRTVMVQRFIPEISEGDKRILLVNGEAVPYALARIPAEDDFRGNLAAGGRGVARPLSRRDKAIASALGPFLRESGLFLVGLDVIGDYLTEVNVTSPTGMQEIFKQTGFNVAGMMMDAVESLFG